MAAYALAAVRRVTMGPPIVQYLETVDATLRPYGGGFIVHGGSIEVLEGSWLGHLIIIEFPNMDAARDWYRSPAYQAIVHLRTGNSEGACIIVDGVPAGHQATDIRPHSERQPQVDDGSAGGSVP
jgi:uncharacterized protein (DUF1330 family)